MRRAYALALMTLALAALVAAAPASRPVDQAYVQGRQRYAALPNEPKARRAAIATVLRETMAARSAPGADAATRESMASAKQVFQRLMEMGDPSLYECLAADDATARRDALVLLDVHPAPTGTPAVREAIARAVPHMAAMAHDPKLATLAFQRLREARTDGFVEIYGMLSDADLATRRLAVSQTEFDTHLVRTPRMEQSVERAIPQLLQLLIEPGGDRRVGLPNTLRNMLHGKLRTRALPDGLKGLRDGDDPAALPTALQRLHIENGDGPIDEGVRTMIFAARGLDRDMEDVRMLHVPRFGDADVHARALKSDDPAVRRGAARSLTRSFPQIDDRLADAVLSMPEVADPSELDVRAVAARAAFSKGPDYLAGLARTALSAADPSAASAAAGMLRVASEAELPRSVVAQAGSRDDFRVGFRADAAAQVRVVGDALAMGELRRKFLLLEDGTKRSHLAMRLSSGEFPMRLGPVSRSVARMINGDAALGELKRAFDSAEQPLEPRPAAVWAPPPLPPPPDSVSHGPGALASLSDWLAPRLAILIGLTLTAYLALRPGA